MRKLMVGKFQEKIKGIEMKGHENKEKVSEERN